jgi:crossover junction endodeoxyribonuclease RusA
MIFEIPFPPAALSPNARLHWRGVAAAKKSYRRTVGLLAIVARKGHKASGRQRLDFTFYPPGNHRYDRDNLIARMKAGIDGIADAMGMDDHNFDIGNIDIAPAVKGGLVRIHISESITEEGK